MVNINYYVQPNFSFPYCNSSNKYINDNKEYKDIGEYIYCFKPKNTVNVDIKKYNKQIKKEYKKRIHKKNKNICIIL